MKMILVVLTLLVSCSIHSQEMDEGLFDFWVGKWDASWTDNEGNPVKGKNIVQKILNGKVIQENFTAEDTGYEGKSFSIFNMATGEWKQIYVDSDGNYFDFIGAIENGNPVFKTGEAEKEGKKIILKMVFRDISNDAFIWEWMRTQDGGKNWKTLWLINYTRI